MLVVVFDVESVGLHGEGFAVGAVVVNVDQRSGQVVEEMYTACPPAAAAGSESGRKWLRENLPRLEYTHETPRGVREAFWRFWRRYAQKGAFLASDCGWPVESNFLSACVADDPTGARWDDGPYPLLDLAPILWVQRRDPKATFGRLPIELPKHDPLADARQSARLLVEAYNL